MNKIAVIGSLNMDLITQTDRLPQMGETVSGVAFRTACGGKGGNQACAAAKLGGQVEMYGCVGNDVFGGELVNSLEKQGVDCSRILRCADTESGTASITVYKGDNSIIIIPGANANVSKAYIDQCWSDLESAALIILQLEIPLETVEYVVDRAKEKEIPVMLNPAPAAALPKEMLSQIDCLVVNETECEFYTGQSVKTREDAEKGLRKILEMGVKRGIVTLGAEGSVFSDGSGMFHMPARAVKAVDSTAAGDTFMGAVATALLEGKSMKEAVEFATSASSIVVTKMGAQTSIPSRKEVEALEAE